MIRSVCFRQTGTVWLQTGVYSLYARKTVVGIQICPVCRSARGSSQDSVFLLHMKTPSPARLFQKPVSALQHVLFWILLYLFYLFQNIFFNEAESGPYNFSVGERAFIVFVYQFSIIISSYFICFRIIPFFVDKKKIWQAFIELVIGLYIIAVLQRLLVIYVMEPLLGTVDGEKETPVQVLTQLKVLAGHYVMGALSGAFPFVIFYLLIERQQMIRRQTEIEKEKVVAELSALKSQLNPHFLFNTLNNIYSLALKQSKQTAPTVDKLSQILDYLLYRCNDTYVPLEKELHLLDNYLDLQKVRFGDRLVIENRYSADRSYTIAPLLLLSLVENMFKHGVEKTAGTVHLHIEIHAAAGELHFTAENPFDSVERVAGGIGLKNLSKQLDLLYPEKYSLKISQTADTFVVQLQLRLT